MAKGDFINLASGTLPASLPGVVSSVDVALTGVTASSIVMLTLTNNVRDSDGDFNAYISSKTTDKITVKASRAQLPAALTFDVIAFAES